MLSVVIIAWNEEKNLPRAISSARRLADEIVVVVDTASTDKTLEIAKKLKCQVFTHAHTGIVEPMRNFSISKAKGEWILLLDADEEIPAVLAEKIKQIIKKPDADYYRLPRKNIIFDKWIKSEHWWPDYVYRLFKKGAVTWDDTIHSIPFTRGTGADLPAEENLALIHHHYDSIGQYVDRLNRYTDHQMTAVLEGGYNFNWTDLWHKPFAEFINQFFARRGYADGIHGLALAGLQGFSELVLYLKLWQHSQFVPGDVSPVSFDQEIANSKSQWRWWLYQSRIDTSFWSFTWWWKLKRKLGI